MTTEGQVLLDRYRLLSQLGAGGQGSVWLAEDQLLQRRVALKELIPHTETIGVEESRARALIEAQAMARVRHRCIVRIHDILFADEDPWIVMEYISGRSLADIIAAERPTERTIAAIGLSVLHGLQAVHAARIVHRDVKPANILADQDGAIYLVDFGIAKFSEESSGGRPGSPSITGRGRILGTPEYIAPEQLIGRPATPASDLWSLGVTLYSTLERHSPFMPRAGKPAQAIKAAILYEEPLVPTTAGPLVDIVLRLLEKDPPRRPSADEVAEVLEWILNTPTGGSARSSRPAMGAASIGGTAPTGAWPTRTGTAGVPKTLLYTSETNPHTRPLDDAELNRREMADAVRVVNQSGTDSGIAILLGKPNVEAAKILADCSADVAAELMTGIAADHAEKAGAILQILSVTRSGQVLDYLPPATAAAVIAAMRPDQRSRVLSQSDVRTVADVIRALPPRSAADVISAMPEKRAVTVLGHVRPTIVAAIFRIIDRDLRTRLMRALSPDVRDLVQRHL
jgi:serine/threonine protein kinase/flagellar motility protein MotE (MotC chaperone)